MFFNCSAFLHFARWGLFSCISKSNRNFFKCTGMNKNPIRCILKFPFFLVYLSLHLPIIAEYGRREWSRTCAAVKEVLRLWLSRASKTCPNFQNKTQKYMAIPVQTPSQTLWHSNIFQVFTFFITNFLWQTKLILFSLTTILATITWLWPSIITSMRAYY